LRITSETGSDRAEPERQGGQNESSSVLWAALEDFGQARSRLGKPAKRTGVDGKGESGSCSLTITCDRNVPPSNLLYWLTRELVTPSILRAHALFIIGSPPDPAGNVGHCPRHHCAQAQPLLVLDPALWQHAGKRSDGMGYCCKLFSAWPAVTRNTFDLTAYRLVARPPAHTSFVSLPFYSCPKVRLTNLSVCVLLTRLQ
jgi:hypothetical protein